jgi:hypothetical protein
LQDIFRLGLEASWSDHSGEEELIHKDHVENLQLMMEPLTGPGEMHDGSKLYRKLEKW